MARSGKTSSKRGKASTKRGRRERQMKGGWIQHPFVRLIIVVGLFACFLGLLILGMVLFNYDRQAARYDISAVGRIPQETRVLDASGELIGYLHGEDVGIPVPLESVSPHFLDALISREDARFYRHHGIDRYGLIRAWLRNLKEGQTVQGASTITMQLTRMSYGLTGRTIQRKLLEMAIARRIEKHYSKEEILSQYVNRVFLGTGMNGIEQAAQGYFGKSSSDLTLPEAAMLAGVIRAPNGFSPFRSYETALREMRSTLARMEDEGVISRKELKALVEERPTVLPQSRWMEMLKVQSKVSGQTHLLQMVEDRVAELLPSYAGVGGLTIQTTFDIRLQGASDWSVNQRLAALEGEAGYPNPRLSGHEAGDPAYVQAAVTVVENYTGAIRAVTGGRDFTHSAFNRATQARRPMGSTFKPLVYGTAFERGLFPGVLISDAAIAAGEIRWDKIGWSPQNSDGVFGHSMPAEIGLIKSRNTMTARVGEWAGIDNVLAMMKHAGLGQSETEISPTIYIGTVGASVRDVASAYSVFATGGIRHRPYFIGTINDRDDSLLYQHEGESYRVLSPGAAWLTSTILKRVLEDGGTGAGLRAAGFFAPAGGKTGTTNDFYDAWFAGYTSRLSASVWVGLDQPGTIMEGAYGGKVAMPIWQDIMGEAQRLGYEFTDFAPPEEVIEMQLCRITGQLANEKCRAADTVYVEQVPHDLIPREFCRKH
ncbi:MAG: transglycosylase domain-containing protein [Verrucomicrobiales bacterium]|nr:transglycosylase domain-containing protein [Verrucomicrobiales bacterium]